MLSSSTSRRESKSSDLFRAAAMALRDAANKTAGIEPNKAASNNNVATVAAVSIKEAIAAVRHEGWMVRYGRRKIGRSFFHTRYFVLDNRLLAYYKKKPKDNMVPLNSLLIDGNCRVEDRGLKTLHGQQQDSMTAKNRKAFASMDFDMELGGQFLFSDHDSTAEDDEERPTLTRKTTIGNGLRIFEELLEVDYPARGCSRAMRAVGVVEATCEAIFGLIMSMDVTRYEWDCSFRNGSLVEEVDGHTAILYHRLHLHWCPMLVWPRDLCYARYWRRNDDGSYVVLFRSTEHLKCGRRRGFVRAFIERLCEYFSQTDDIHITPRIPEDVNKSHHDIKRTDEPTEKIDLSCFLSILHRDPEEKSRNCWTIPDSKIFKVRSKNFPQDKSKIPAASYLMELAAIDWFKDTKRMDNVARQKGCVAQVAADRGMHTFVVNIQIPGSTQYSLVMYFVTNTLRKGSLLQRFFDGDDEFRNSRLKLIPSVPKGSWIVRQSVGSTPCLLGKAVDCSYVRGPAYLEVDVDIGSSAVANGVLGIVFGVVTTLVVDMAFLIQANTYEELPEQVIGAARLAHVEPATAVVPDLSNTSNDSSNSNNDNNNNNNNNNGSSEDDLSKKTN
ncbi:Protein ENHANCED DISEASE RESISTANCE 2 [Zea mays]|uniref:Protein ENHANCED DISEASE RESISTANCE 2 n=1 Tax=Zea mays TaxID=4577 RepID=A0A1D6QV87_MAIZE|nr:Protein ENHANCED DISEASE RESISTANCE 2 [Zea mays]